MEIVIIRRNNAVLDAEKGLCEGGNSPAHNGLALEFHASNWGERPNPLRGWRTDRWKYVETIDNGDGLYNLIEDPLETQNLIEDPESSAARDQLGGQLATWVRSVPDTWPRVPQPEREVER